MPGGSCASRDGADLLRRAEHVAARRAGGAVTETLRVALGGLCREQAADDAHGARADDRRRLGDRADRRRHRLLLGRREADRRARLKHPARQLRHPTRRVRCLRWVELEQLADARRTPTRSQDHFKAPDVKSVSPVVNAVERRPSPTATTPTSRPASSARHRATRRPRTRLLAERRLVHQGAGPEPQPGDGDRPDRRSGTVRRGRSRSVTRSRSTGRTSP